MQLDPSMERPLISFCIGSDRSTGDSLGPLVGYMLQQKQPHNKYVFGTLDNPVHATNLKDKLSYINGSYKNPIIIAIDACLGKIDSVGNVAYVTGPLRPGAAVNKDLPPVGDMAISGIVNVGGFMEYLVLQNTRLSLVMSMADKIAKVLHWVYLKRANIKN